MRVLKLLLALRHAPDVQVSWTSCLSFYKVALTSIDVEDQLLSVPNTVLALSTRGAIYGSSVEDRLTSCAYGCYGNQLWHGPSNYLGNQILYISRFFRDDLSVPPTNIGEETKTTQGVVHTYGTEFVKLML